MFTPRSAVPVRLSGIELLADLTGALLWPAEATVVVADLHLEKASSFAARGQFLPPYDTRATLTRLAALLERTRPERVVCLGDSFHDEGAGARLAAADGDLLRRMMEGREWIWIQGNHDPNPPAIGAGVQAHEEWRRGPLVFRHAARAAGSGEISGHFHPKASVATPRGRVSGRCFVADRRRIVLPAFGALTGGLDTRAPAIASLFPGQFELHVIGARHIATLPGRRAA
jgi:hypothetical protein